MVVEKVAEETEEVAMDAAGEETAEVGMERVAAARVAVETEAVAMEMAEVAKVTAAWSGRGNLLGGAEPPGIRWA